MIRNREFASPFPPAEAQVAAGSRFREAILFPSFSFSTSRRLASVGRIAGGAIALAASCVLAASAALAAGPQVDAAFLPPPPAPMTRYASAELGALINSGPGAVVSGERLNVALLRRFYTAHGFEPVWTTRQEQAESLLNAVLNAGDHGLAPELFHANLLRHAATLPPLDRELLLSDAFLSYASALAHGVVPAERRTDDEALTPQPIDVAAVLDTAIRSRDPGATIEALAPTTPTYRMLRQVLQAYRSTTPAGDKGTSNRLRAIEVNLERERWLPRELPAERVWINAADARLVLYRGDRPIFSTLVIVGQDGQPNQTPEFQVAINGVLYNPPWNVPESITTEEILPKMGRDPNYLTRHNMVLRPEGGLQQLPGPGAALGQIKFEMENRFDVYLHDTPSKNLFARDNRRISHGCIRVQNPRELAALLMQEPIDAINREIATGGTNRVDLPTPVQAFVVYETAFVDSEGSLQFRPDIYNRDGAIWAQLHSVRRPMADFEPAGQRRS
jgi:murein L,D-transpeptidase YcbB/YkuD